MTYAVDVLRVVAAPGGPDSADVLVLRPGRTNPAWIDANPSAACEQVAVNVAARRTSGLVLEVLPLIPVGETPKPAAPWPVGGPDPERAARRGLPARAPPSRPWLGARRVAADALRAPFNSSATCGLLEETLLTQPRLTPAQLNHPDWP